MRAAAAAAKTSAGAAGGGSAAASACVVAVELRLEAAPPDATDAFEDEDEAAAAEGDCGKPERRALRSA